MPATILHSALQDWTIAEEQLWRFSTAEESDKSRDAFCAMTDRLVRLADGVGRNDLSGAISDYKEEWLHCRDQLVGKTFPSAREVLATLAGETNLARPKALGAANRLKQSVGSVGQDQPIELLPAGFRLRGGEMENLAGKPRAMLKALLDSRNHRMSPADLGRDLWDDSGASWREQAVKDTACKLRKRLLQALRKLGIDSKKLLPSHGKGADLSYQLDLSGFLP